MALDETIVEGEVDGSRLSSEEEKDLEIAVNLAENLIDEGGWQVLDQAQQSSDPGTVIGQFLMQLGAQLGESLPFPISPRIMLAEGGWVEQISDYLQEEYDIPKQVMDRAEIFIASSAEQMAQGQQQQQPAAPPVGASVVPQQGVGNV